MGHLQSRGSITGAEAWRLYSLYRLSSIIHILRHEYNMDISMVMQDGIDAHGNKIKYGKYFYTKPDQQ